MVVIVEVVWKKVLSTCSLPDGFFPLVTSSPLNMRSIFRIDGQQSDGPPPSEPVSCGYSTCCRRHRGVKKPEGKPKSMSMSWGRLFSDNLPTLPPIIAFQPHPFRDPNLEADDPVKG